MLAFWGNVDQLGGHLCGRVVAERSESSPKGRTPHIRNLSFVANTPFERLRRAYNKSHHALEENSMNANN